MRVRPQGPAARRRRPLRLVAAVIGTVALLLVGCGAEETPTDETADGEAAEDEPDPATDPPEDETDPASDEEMTPITVGDIAGTPSAFLQFTVDQGFFEEVGLEVTVDVSPGGAANVPGVLSGDYQIAGSNVVSMLLARGEGLPLQIVSAGTFATEEPEDDFSAVLVLDGSDIQGPEDLDGRSIGVNALANIAEVSIRAALENEGGSHENIDFVEIPFPDMVPALEEGRVDAIHVIEPFLSIGSSQGHREVLIPYNQMQPGVAIGSYFSSEEYIAQNADILDRFVTGVSAGSDYIAANPDEFRAALPELADLEEGIAEAVRLPDWGGPVDTESVELIADLMERFGIITDAPSVEEMVYVP